MMGLIGRGRFPVVACLAAGVIGAFGFVGVSFAASLATLDKPAQVGTGAAAVRFDPPPPPPVNAPSAQQLLLNGVFAALNEVRSAAGLAPFEWNDRVTAAAQVHAADMAATRTMTHTGSDGSNAGDRLTRAGFTWSAWGENVAAGFSDPAAVVAAWMASPTHRRQVLGSLRFVGVGVATSSDGAQYWALDLAS